MKIGFTGTRKGMSDYQKKTLKELLIMYGANNGFEFHHGDCIGADEQAHNIANECGYRILIHPPNRDTYRAHCDGFAFMVKEYLERNRDIVNACDVLLACPPTNYHILKSGTWYTVRYAKKIKKDIKIIYPSKIED